MTPTPPETATTDAEPAPPATTPQPTSAGLKPVHLVAVAAAIAGGALVTLLLMDVQPAAETSPRPVARATMAAPPSSVQADPDPTAAPAAAIDPATPVKWSSKTQARWVNPSRTSAAFELHAERPVAVWNDTVTPVLVVRCAKGRVDAFVYTSSAARIEPEDDNHTVKLSFDEQAGTHQRWPDSVEHDALFAPNGRALTDRLASAQTFGFTFVPHNAGPATALFDVRGLQEKMAETKACGK
jgi:hypothetical protein